MARTLKNVPIPGNKRKNVARTPQVGRTGFWRNGRLDGPHPIRAADTPVVTPSAASMETVKAVPYELVFLGTICGRSSDLTLSLVMRRQTMPLHSRMSVAIYSLARESAEKLKSPSFFLSSSSTIRTPPPHYNDDTAFKTRSWRVPQWVSRFWRINTSLLIIMPESGRTKTWRKTQRGKYSIPQPVFRRLLFHPDYDRRLRICTGSADPFT